MTADGAQVPDYAVWPEVLTVTPFPPLSASPSRSGGPGFVVRAECSTGAFLGDFCLGGCQESFVGCGWGAEPDPCVWLVRSGLRGAANGSGSGPDGRPRPGPRGQHAELRCSEGRWSTVQVTNWPERNGSFHLHQNLHAEA